MQVIDFTSADRIMSEGHTSKGDQPKWKQSGNWYKADHMGYEALSEIIVSRLLTWSNADDFVVYQPVFIHYNDKVIPGCSSRDFTNLTGVGAYLTAILELDCLTLNEDRHTNNLAVLRNEETKEFRLCPIFDNGLSLLSDLNDYPLTDDLYTCIERVQAKPFDSDHVEQVTAAEQLYGRQLTFRISHEELRSELNLLSEAYSPDILQRAERVLLEQKRKHSWLF